MSRTFELHMAASSIEPGDNLRPVYEALGFKFKPADPDVHFHKNRLYVVDDFDRRIAIDSLQELMNLADAVGPLVFDVGGIEIYNDYRE